MKKNISSEYAYMLIESIESRSKELAESFDTEIIVGWIILIAGIFLLIFILNAGSGSLALIVWGPILIIGGIVRLSTSYAKKEKIPDN